MDAEELTARPDPQFEGALDAIVAGDVLALASLLREAPDLIRARSRREHHATLLHYVAANGVEDFRQKCPQNAVDVAKTLLESGAEVDALVDMYDSKYTTMDLLVSSDHPAKAGLEAALVETLLDYGAAVNGVDDDGSPLMTALQYEHGVRFRQNPDPAQVLARRGARVDHIVAAAALGREDLVRSFVNADGSLKAAVPLVPARLLRRAYGPHEVDPQDPKTNLELALVWASQCGRTGVVDFLLQKGVDPRAEDRVGTALHWAAWYGHLETVETLLKWNAPLEATNCFGGTILDQTVWATVHRNPAGMDYVLSNDRALAIVQRLADAGAKDPGWLQNYLHQPLDERISRVLRDVIARSHE
jgi:ankyrin repeat protein